MEPNIARMLLKSKDENKNQLHILPSPCQFDPAVMVDMFPGPALLVDGHMDVKHHNIFAKNLLGPLQEGQAFLKAMISRCLSNDCPDSQKTTLDGSDGLRHYDLYAFPLKQEKTSSSPIVFLFGRETTIEHNLTNALVDSRQMFKDLVSCSTDFAWETDAHGNFIYASPKGILGYTAYELNGKNSRDMIIGGEENNPFGARDKVSEMELWLQRADGAMACLLVSSVPVLDNHARWQGARGVCRDITPIREREATLRRTHKREHVLSNIIATIRDMTTPSEMLEKALTATIDGIKVDCGYIIQKTTFAEGSFKAVIKQQQGAPCEPDLIYKLCQKAMEFWQETTPTAGTTQTLNIGPHQILMGMTKHHSVSNGAILLIRTGNKNQSQDGQKNWQKEWSEDEVHLFKGITTHLGIALEQAITHEELEKRAYTDDLTNLLNRRAFAQQIKKRLQHQQRSLKEGALLYLDLDNFKNVNDSKGHAHGDLILQELAQIIKESVRVGDYSARLGGDEFAIWLDEINGKDALLKAQNIIVSGTRLAHLADVDGPQMSISIGLAVSNPDKGHSFDQLMEQADTALYQAKANGKASCVMFDPECDIKQSTDSETINDTVPRAEERQPERDPHA
ncbi:MAG: hypothetical protein COB54_03110 [Alphaproteobacteria bacterium]|nr:MAG: hypothetical protein COB54_03110 [Alphaproteobacteria bacterium]